MARAKLKHLHFSQTETRVGLMIAFPEGLIVFLILMVAFAAFTSMVGVLRSSTDGQVGALWRTEAKINVLLRHTGIEFDTYKALHREPKRPGQPQPFEPGRA
jgi:hypothetical protein